MSGDDEKSCPKEKKNNILPLWGNERSMNLNPLILTNIQSSHYFKGRYGCHHYFIYYSIYIFIFL
jgi:hypothetical protein